MLAILKQRHDGRFDRGRIRTYISTAMDGEYYQLGDAVIWKWALRMNSFQLKPTSYLIATSSIGSWMLFTQYPYITFAGMFLHGCYRGTIERDPNSLVCICRFSNSAQTPVRAWYRFDGYLQIRSDIVSLSIPIPLLCRTDWPVSPLSMRQLRHSCLSHLSHARSRNALFSSNTDIPRRTYG